METKYIESQMKKHTAFIQSFKKCELTMCNEHYHPKTGKRITCTEMDYLIRKDREKRAKSIIKKLIYDL